MKLSNLLVKNQSTMCGLFITFCLLSSIEVFSAILPNKSCNSGQCISDDENVKKNVGGPLFVTIALSSSLTFCQYAFVPDIFATYRDNLA